MHVQSCCFANLNHLLFDVLIAVAVGGILNSPEYISVVAHRNFNYQTTGNKRNL